MAVAAAITVVLAAVPAQASPSRTRLEGLFDIGGGHRLYLRCTGHGGPTVVMDASLGADSTTWAEVEPAISRYTRVCVYDRAGMGRSDPVPSVTTSAGMVTELRALLHVAGEEGPYVLVGHSLGGLNMQLFARDDGGESVAGVVFVDATPAQFVAVLDSLGFPVPQPAELPEPVDIRASAIEVLTAPAFPPVPLLVLTHGLPMSPPALETAWQELQAYHAQLSPLGELVVADESHHFIQLDQPELVIRGVIGVVKQTNARRDRGIGSSTTVLT
jgi:pimeloyl-ACP methyl ester carboxylesterase